MKATFDKILTNMAESLFSYRGLQNPQILLPYSIYGFKMKEPSDIEIHNHLISHY